MGWQSYIGWLESLYEPHQLVAGFKLKLPWSRKGGQVSFQKAVVLDPEADTVTKRFITVNLVNKFVLCNYELV